MEKVSNYEVLGLVVFKSDEKGFVVVRELEGGLLDDSLRTNSKEEQDKAKEYREYIYFLKEDDKFEKGDIVSIMSVRKDTRGRKDKVLVLKKPTFKGTITVTGVKNYGFALINVNGKNASIFLPPFVLNKLRQEHDTKVNFDLIGKEVELEVKWGKKGLKAFVV